MGTTSDDTQGSDDSASFASLLNQIGKKHLHDIEDCNRRLAALQKENASLDKQLKALQRVRASLGATACEQDALPGAVEVSRGASPGSAGDTDEESAVEIATRLPSILRRQTEASGASGADELAAGADGSAASARLSPRSTAAASLGHEGLPSSPAHARFPTKALWKQAADFAPPQSVETTKVYDEMTASAMEQLAETTPSERVYGHRRNVAWFISTPASPRRLMWDMLGAVLIFYDLIQLPLDAFKPPQTGFMWFMDWFTLIFWTINMPASLMVAFSEEGLLVVEPHRIAKRYFRTWFALDLVVVIPDWVFTFAREFSSDGNSSAQQSVTLLRALRLVRLVRLLRLLKLRRMFATVNDLINSEYVSIIVSIVKMMGILLVINHLLCCMWYALADNMSKDETTWVEAHGFEGASWEYLYFTAFHWSITHFSPASMHVQPQNLWERVYALFVVTFALVGFSYIVGSITGSLATLRSMNAEESKLFWELRRYLYKNKVQQELSIRIQKYLEHMWQAMQESKPVKDVRLIQLLSEQLNSELKYELALHQLRIHPLFSELCEISSVTVHRLANHALSHKLLCEGDTLFHAGEVATHMYIVVKGRFCYLRADTLGLQHLEWVDKGEDWISEPALWTEQWSHCGRLTAVAHADNVTIDAGSFGDQVKKNPKAHVWVSGYATNFLKWLNSQKIDDLSDISQGEDVGDLIKSFFPASSETFNRRASRVSAQGWLITSAVADFSPGSSAVVSQ